MTTQAPFDCNKRLRSNVWGLLYYGITIHVRLQDTSGYICVR